MDDHLETSRAAAALRAFFDAWQAGDLPAFEALLTDHRRGEMHLGDWTFAGKGRVEFGPITAAPEVITRHLATYGHLYRASLTPEDVCCFRASIMWTQGAAGEDHHVEEAPWLWWLVRDASGDWKVDDWGA